MVCVLLVIELMPGQLLVVRVLPCGVGGAGGSKEMERCGRGKWGPEEEEDSRWLLLGAVAIARAPAPGGALGALRRGEGS